MGSATAGPRNGADPAVATKVNGVVITSSPGCTPSASRPSSSASDPDAHPTAAAEPTKRHISASNFSTSGVDFRVKGQGMAKFLEGAFRPPLWAVHLANKKILQFFEYGGR